MDIYAWVIWLAALVLLYAAGCVVLQMTVLFYGLRNAPQPHWDEIVEALWEFHRAMGPQYVWLARVTMPIGQRLWPPMV